MFSQCYADPTKRTPTPKPDVLAVMASDIEEEENFIVSEVKEKEELSHILHPVYNFF